MHHSKCRSGSAGAQQLVRAPIGLMAELRERCRSAATYDGVTPRWPSHLGPSELYDDSFRSTPLDAFTFQFDGGSTRPPFDVRLVDVARHGVRR